MSTMSVKHMLKAYEPRIAVYGASLHTQDPDIAVTVGKDGMCVCLCLLSVLVAYMISEFG